MATLDQLFQAMGMFSNAAKEYGVSQGIQDATKAVNDLKQRSDLDFKQQIAAQQGIATQLQSGLAGLGAPQAQIAAAVGAIQPPKIQSSADALAMAQRATTPEERASYLSEAKQFSALEGDTALATKEPVMARQHQYDMELARLKARADNTGGLTPAQMLDETRKDQLQEIPGLKRTRGVQVRPEEATKLREGWGEFQKADETLSKLQKLIAKRGAGSSLTGPERSRAESLYGQLQISLKETSNLGALAGPDIQVLGEQLPAPTGFSSMFTQDSNMLAKLQATQLGLRSRVEKRLQASGYSPAAGGLGASQDTDNGGTPININMGAPKKIAIDPARVDALRAARERLKGG